MMGNAIARPVGEQGRQWSNRISLVVGTISKTWETWILVGPADLLEILLSA